MSADRSAEEVLEANNLVPEHFPTETHKELYDMILEHRRKAAYHAKMDSVLSAVYLKLRNWE